MSKGVAEMRRHYRYYNNVYLAVSTSSQSSFAELRKHRRRNTATGKTSMFAGLLYCADCGSKLYYSAAKSIKEH